MSYLLEGDDLLKNAMKNDQGARRVTRQPKTLLVYFYLSSPSKVFQSHSFIMIHEEKSEIHLSLFSRQRLPSMYLCVFFSP